MEIERKFKVFALPNLSEYKYHEIEQAYINDDPVIRVRREDDTYYMTYKGSGMLAREEYNLPLNKESYDNLSGYTKHRIISKRRYLIPYGDHTIELDIFKGELEGLVIAEVEFDSVDEANGFTAPDWFSEDVTYDKNYHNSNLCRMDDATLKHLLK